MSIQLGRLFLSGPPRLRIGELNATEGATQLPEDDLRQALNRHLCGDWGDVPAEDAEANNQALVDGSRIVSAFATKDGTKFWIISDPVDDNGARTTTFLLPEEY